MSFAYELGREMVKQAGPPKLQTYTPAPGPAPKPKPVVDPQSVSPAAVPMSGRSMGGAGLNHSDPILRAIASGNARASRSSDVASQGRGRALAGGSAGALGATMSHLGRFAQ